MRKFTSLVMLLVLGALVSTSFADFEDKIEKSYKVRDGGTLTINADLGSIKVSAAGSGDVHIVVNRTVDESSDERANEILKDLRLDFIQSGDDVTVTAEYENKDSFFGWKRRHLRLQFVVSVPKKYNVNLKTSGGSITVDDLQGSVTSRTSGGSLKFGHIEGPVMGKTSGGSIGLEGCRGDAEIRTSGGSIRIGEVEGKVFAHTSGGSISIASAKGDVIAETSGGGIEVHEVGGSIDASTSGGGVRATITRQPDGPCRLKTSGGSITVTMAADIKVDLNAGTSGGRVRTEFPVLVEGEISKSNLNAKINGGGPELNLHTSGGSIYLNKLAAN